MEEIKEILREIRSVGHKMDQMDGRLINVEIGVVQMSSQLNRVEVRLCVVEKDMVEIKDWLGQLDARLGTVERGSRR